MPQLSWTPSGVLARRAFIGGSDARVIMGSDEAALIRLWHEKRGEVDPEDLSGNLPVQLGKATEDLNRTWYERNTGRQVGDVQRFVKHSAIAYMAATLDGTVDAIGAVFEAKFMLPWSFSEEAAAEKYMAQVQHNMWVTHLRTAVLSIITGGGKWVEITIPMDPLYLSLLVAAEKKFWRCVKFGVIQTTAVDQPSRMLNLTTLLAHSSGEWIASYWPVCPIAEITYPHRKGAALTYARRYALFTLVGIAGEDDLDAPDICMPSQLPSAPSSTAWSTGGSPSPRQTQGNGKVHAAPKAVSPTMATLGIEESAALRARLLSEIAELASQDSAATWAREALAAKNTLTAADAQALEDAFEQKLAAFASVQATTPVMSGKAPPVPAPISQKPAPSKSADQPQPAGVDPPASINKSVLTISAPRRYRSKEHLRYVIAQPCLFCARKPSDAHHLRFMQPRALGRKTSDEFAVPLEVAPDFCTGR